MDSAANRLMELTQSVCSRLAARERNASTTVTLVESFDDGELTALLQDASRLRAEADALISAAAGVVAKRSERALGYAGLAQREGHRTPIAMVQALTGGSRAEAARQVRLGEALGEADAAVRMREASEDVDVGDAPRDADAGTGSGGATEFGAAELGAGACGPGECGASVFPPMPWYEPITTAVADHTISAEVGAAILRGLGEPCERVTGDALRAAAAELIAESAGADVDELTRRARWARDRLDPVGVEDRTRARFEARSWRFGRDKVTGARTAWIVFDDESAAWVQAIIDAALAPRRGGPRFVDPAEQRRAKQLLDDPRSNDQLVFDTLIEVMRAGSLADAATVFGARQPGVRVVITESNVRARDAEGHVTGTGFYESTGEAVPGSVVERHRCNAGVVPVTVDANGSPLDVGREQRLFTARQRVALRVRDGGCMHPGCGRGPEFCEAHHIQEWAAAHGKTDIADGILLCRHHHMLLHDNRWKIARDGPAYRLIPPASVDPQRTPIPLRSKSPLRHRPAG